MLSMPTVLLDFDAAVYSLRAVKMGAYQLADRLDCRIELQPDKIHVTAASRHRLLDLEALSAEFRSSVLDHELRRQIALETEPVRNLIIAHAFSATSLLDRVGETADYADDPEGIAQPDQTRRQTGD